jgi:glycopeptide antibiotics resistance protein
MVQKCLEILAWLTLGCIIFVTLSPIGLRPIVTRDPGYERLIAYAILGVLFGLAYPRRVWMTLCVVVGTAVILEGLQYLTPDRHGQLLDLLEKACGGLLGLLVANVASKYRLCS